MKSMVVSTPLYSQKYGGFPDEAACALVFHHAVQAGCEEIIVECQGIRGRKYTIDEVREWIARHPLYANLAKSTVPVVYLSGVYRQTPDGLITPDKPVSSNPSGPGRKGVLV